MKKATTFTLLIAIISISFLICNSASGQRKKGFRLLKENRQNKGSLPVSTKREAAFNSLSQEEIRAYETDVMRKIADLALIPPILNSSPLPRYDNNQLDYGMTIGIERTPKGRIWAAWVAGGDNPKAFFVLANSNDNGETWSKPCMVIDSHSSNLPMDRSVLVGNLWTDPLGRLWLFFDQSMNQFDGRGGLWVTRCDNPDSEVPVWSAPLRIWHGCMLNKPTVLASGEWLLPAYLLQHSRGIGPFANIFPELDSIRGVNILVSKDQGITWKFRACIPFPNPDWHEPMVVERSDGSLWMWTRTTKGIAESISQDGGFSWSPPTYPANIKHPNSRFHLRCLASGNILFIKNGEKINEHTGRVKLSAWLSQDEGKSWQGGLVLDDRSGVTYPDGFQAPDGMIYISYDHERSLLGEVLMARFTEEDILAGKLLNPKSKIKMLISRPLKNQNTSG